METKPAATMEKRFAEIGARIDGLLEDAERSGFITGVKAELKVWREWIDEARLQSTLGTMEARDRMAEAKEILERLHSRMANRIEDLEDLSDPVPGAREAVRQELEVAKIELSSSTAFEKVEN